MTEEEKRREIDFLYQQLDKCGQILADWDEDKRPTYYEREYRKIMRQLAKLEPENWDYPYFKKDYTRRNENVAAWCKAHRCTKCGGELKQSRSGSLRVVCQSCHAKFQLITKKEMSTEYNLSNPSVAEEERMIQDRIDAEYDALEAYHKAVEKQMEEDYYKQMEEQQ